MAPLDSSFGSVVPMDGRWKARWERLRRRERLARERLEVVSEAGKLLSSSLDHETTLRRMLSLTLPRLGQFGLFDVIDEVSGDVRRIIQAPEHPDRRALLEQTLGSATRGSHLERPIPFQGLMDRDEAEVVRMEHAFLSSSFDAQECTLLQAMRVASCLVVPLRYQRRTLGGLVLFLGIESDRRHGTADVLVAAELAQRGAAAIENARLYRQTQDALRKRDDFLSVASHELKTPLTTLELQIASLLRSLKLGRISPDQTETLVDRLDRAEHQVQRLSHTIEELLDASRLGGERLHLQKVDLPFRELIEHAVQRLRPEVERSGCELTLSLASVHCLGDRSRVHQVIYNLLSNAFRYGEGKPVEVTLSQLPGRVRLQVTDHGIGISEEDQTRIFERFERAVSPRRYSGLGMGLWMARQIVDAHGGQIGVVSVLGVGSSFTVDLPA